MPLRKESILVITAITGAVVSVMLNLLLIPVWGHVGAILAAISAEIATIIIQIILIRRHGKGLLVYPSEAWKILAAGSFMLIILAVGTLLAPHSLKAQIAVWVISSGVYVGILWLLKEPLTRQVTGRLAAIRQL